MAKKFYFLGILLSFFFLHSRATHIVGGEFQLVYSGTGTIYNLYMKMYYDDLNAQSGLLDGDLVINASVFSKATNIRQRNIEIRRTSADLFTYNTNGCNNADLLKTRLLDYSGTVDLAGLYEPQGYYVSFERCCRNYQSINIVHFDFFGNAISGQVFYLEFPPILKSGVSFINSSPIFTPVPTQYYCRNNINTVSFAATDLDGDQLVYRMATPLKGHASLAPGSTSSPEFPWSAPYDSIGWISGYNLYNSIPGNPALNVNSQTGLLTFRPSNNGLYVFAVVCEEYRNGQKIGEVRRDFQFLVQDCPVTYPPSVGINSSNNQSSNTTNTNWGNNAPDTLVVKLNKDTCYTIFVSDSSTKFGISDVVNIFYGNTNLPPSVLSFSPSNVSLVPGADTAQMSMCFSTCDKLLISRDSVYYLDLLVLDGIDGTCPRRSSMLRTYVFVDVDETNEMPVIKTTIPESSNNILGIYPDSLLSFYVYGLDTDIYDLREITVTPFRFALEDYNMSFYKVFENEDSIAYKFDWIPNCSYLEDKIQYRLTFTLKDKSCIADHNVDTTIILRLKEAETELKNIVPPNLVTPNGDFMNDCFYIPNIPPDNCTYIFKSIEIYNRWGARVYKSSNRNFRWCPDDVTDGIYYYNIDLSEKEVKGWVHILR